MIKEKRTFAQKIRANQQKIKDTPALNAPTGDELAVKANIFAECGDQETYQTLFGREGEFPAMV